MRPLAAGVTLLTLALIAIALPWQPPAGTAAAATASVSVQDNKYVPSTITITTGDTVEWTWAGSNIHTVTSTGAESFDSGAPSRLARSATCSVLPEPSPTSAACMALRCPAPSSSRTPRRPQIPPCPRRAHQPRRRVRQQPPTPPRRRTRRPRQRAHRMTRRRPPWRPRPPLPRLSQQAPGPHRRSPRGWPVAPSSRPPVMAGALVVACLGPLSPSLSRDSPPPAPLPLLPCTGSSAGREAPRPPPENERHTGASLLTAGRQEPASRGAVRAPGFVMLDHPHHSASVAH